jgi:predicted acetyltransferase
MDIAIQHVSPDARLVVHRLLQLYEYEVSRVFGADLEDDGLYHVIAPDIFWQPPYRVFLIRADTHLAGFAFVTRHPTYFGTGETWLMNEFFVLRKYQRRGVGEYVARQLFDQFPGRWEVAELAENPVSQAFWRRVIRRYTNGQFSEVTLNSDRWRGPVQSFASKVTGVPPRG